MKQDLYTIPEQTLRQQAKNDDITALVVGAAILKAGKILVIRRVPDDFLGGYYELPGGGVDEGETLQEAVVRENLEETGLQVTRILGIAPGFDYQTPKRRVRQFNFRVETENAQIKLNPGEHDAWAWINLNDLENYPMTLEMKKSILLFNNGVRHY